VYIQIQTSIPANSVVDNVLAGNQFEFLNQNVVIEYGLVASAAGLELDVLISERAITTRMLPSTQNRVPIYDEDFTVRAGALGGDRQIVRARNTTGGAIVLFTSARMTPVI
jgi:hypothetical protein